MSLPSLATEASNAPQSVSSARFGARERALLKSVKTYVDAAGNDTLANGKIWVGNSSNVATAVTMSGDATLSNAGALTIAAGAVTGAKMAALTSGNILVGNGSNVATSVAVSGDATLANTGAITIAANAVTAAKMANATITTTQISASAAITGSQLAASAGITGSQIASGTVALGNLTTGITPSHVVKFAGKYTTTGGAATEAQTVTGVASTDIVLATLQAHSSTQTLILAVPTTNTITYTFSADPSSSTIVSYMVLRAAS